MLTGVLPPSRRCLIRGGRPRPRVVPGAWSLVGEVRWQVAVEPSDGSGYLTEFDVDQACRGIPDGASVDLVVAEMENFSPAAVGVLARRLAGVDASVVIKPSARRAGAGFVEMFSRAQDHYLAFEVDQLRDRPA